jgi:hypothetical protein
MAMGFGVGLTVERVFVRPLQTAKKNIRPYSFFATPTAAGAGPALWQAARAPLGLVSFALERMVFPPRPEPSGC